MSESIQKCRPGGAGATGGRDVTGAPDASDASDAPPGACGPAAAPAASPATGRQGRQAFIAAAAELYGRPVDAGADELAALGDTAALLLAFPWCSDAELLEALWALDQWRSDPAGRF